MKKLLLLPFFVLSLWAHGQYDPSKATVTNKPLGVAQGVPTDARSYYYSPSLFIWRPYQSTAEVLSSLNIAKFRMGNFPIYVNVGGTLNSNGTFTGGRIKEYWFKDGTTDADLVEKFSAAAGETLSGTIAQLRALTTGTGKVYTSTDRGGGLFIDIGVKANDDFRVDDGATLILSNNNHWLQRQTQSPVDVAWFGAKTDGTDASAAVQAAINSLPSTGGEIYFPATGEYKILSKINITKNFVTIRGGGVGTVIRNAGNNYAFEVTGQYVTIKDVSIWGYGGALGAGANANNKGIYFNSGNNFVLDRVVIRYHGGHGVVCNNGVWIGSFISSELEHNGGDGLNSISPTGLGTNQNGNAFSFTNCTIAYNNGNGINWKATTLNITGCTIEGNRGRGLYFNCTGLTNSIYNINVTGNYFESNILGEIEFVSEPSTIIYNANVENNEFFSVSTASTAFVKFSGASYVNKNCKVGKNAYTFAGTVIHAVDGGETFSRSCFVDDALFEGNDIDDRFVNLGFAKTSVAADGMIIRSSDYTINRKDFGIGSNGLLTVYGDASNGSINITLPLTTDMVNRTVKVIKIDGSPNTVTVHAGGSELLNSGANDVLAEIYQSGEYKSSGIFGKIFKTIETSPTAILKFGNQSSTGVKTFNGGNPIIINGNTMEYKNNDTSYWGTGITGEAGKKDFIFYNSKTSAIDLRINSANDKAAFWSTVSASPATANNELATLGQLKDSLSIARTESDPSSLHLAGGGTVTGFVTLNGNVGVGTGVSAILPLEVKAANNVHIGFGAGEVNSSAIQLNAFNNGGAANIPMEFKATAYNFTNAPLSILPATSGNQAAQLQQITEKIDSAYAASQFIISNADGTGDTVMVATGSSATFKRVKPGNGVSISSDATSMTISAGGGIVKVLPNADYTITTSDHTLILTEVAANRTITLPAASTMPNKEINLSVRATTTGRWLLSGSFVQKSTVGVNPISENFVNSGLPNGINYRLVSDGVKWYDINN